MEKFKKDLFSENLPETFVPLNDKQQTVVYNHNIRPHNNEDDVEGYLYDSLICLYPLTANSVFLQLMAEKYGLDYEQKLQNEYTSAVEGIDEGASKQPYIDFLNQRKALKMSVDNDCLNNAIA